MRIEDRQKAYDWLNEWEKLHKESRLRRDVYDQWKWGNRGAHPDWRTNPAMAPKPEHVLENIRGRMILSKRGGNIGKKLQSRWLCRKHQNLAKKI
jgi:hypothetical protein